MKLLILGGTRFVGRHITETALARGHEVTLFNRGNNSIFPELETLVGDRNHDLSALANRHFDAVIDTSAYFPRQVQLVIEALSEVPHYTFISTISVYANQELPQQSEDGDLATVADPKTEEVTGETYGGLKVLCERELNAAFPGHLLIIRPGLVVGPHDPTDRFSYWPLRVAEGGEVLAAKSPELPVQFIDARDLALFTVSMTERQESGTYNAISPADSLTLGEMLETARTVSGSDARFVYADEGFLLEQGVRPFADLPFWIPGEGINFSRVSTERAQAKGLTVRPLAETVKDTLEWFRAERGDALKTGLSRERERELLELYRNHTGA